ncbi:hypothetical protein KAV47_08140 [Candidatus Bathyarchaeota archaeon]|nr:hypothetical protein [Candidatus Bathyarchaeota archaeon]
MSSRAPPPVRRLRAYLVDGVVHHQPGLQVLPDHVGVVLRLLVAVLGGLDGAFPEDQLR